jgi:uncharacterized membrane protein YfcA
VEPPFVLDVGLAAGTISGIVGFGSSIMLMPVLVIVFGPQVVNYDISPVGRRKAAPGNVVIQDLTPYFSSALCSPMRGGARRIGGRWPSKDSGSETTS